MEQKNVFLTAKAALTGLAASFTAAFGWFGWLVTVWVICMAGDYLTGSAAALHQGQWKSGAARDGLWHKAGMIVVAMAAGTLDLLVALMLDHLPGITLAWDYSVLVCPLVLCWYCLTELGSILENAGALGAPIHPGLRRAIEALADQVDGEDDSKNE